MKKVRVKLGSNSYEIRIGSGVLAHAGDWLKEIGFSDKLVIITDPTVKKLHSDALQ